MAQAQVTITAVDRTQAAINSAMRSMKTLERTAKVTAKAVNFAFGFLTGSVLVSAFGKLTKAAEGTEEGRKAIEKLNMALKDPTIVSSVQTLTSALITGFSKVVEVTARVIENITAISRSSFVKSPDTILKFLASVMGGNGAAASAALVSEMVQGAVAGGKIPGAATPASPAVPKIASTAKAERERIASEINRLNEMTMTSTEKTLTSFAEFQQAINKLLLSGTISQEVATARMLERIDEILPEVEVTGKREIIPGAQEKLTQLTVFAEEAARQMQQSFAAFLFDPFQDGLRGMLRGFVDMIRQMVAQLLAQQLLLAFLSPFKGTAGIFGQMYGALEKRATGGPVSANRPYIVGERGPELFVPGSSGGIVPNNAMMGGGMTVAPVYNIDARGATADLQSALPGILQENNRRIFEELDRRYGVGR
jgi:hypothetical protein